MHPLAAGRRIEGGPMTEAPQTAPRASGTAHYASGTAHYASGTAHYASVTARLLKPADCPDNFTRSLYQVAPYRGCAHGCRYCDGRAERYYVEGDFERDILERTDIPDRLERDIPKARESGLVAFGSGTTDPYQPREEALSITGRCAGILAGYAARAGAEARRLPALVMTKSALALRDLPLWRRVNEKAGFILLISLTSLDEGLREIMEPGASRFAERLDLARAYKEAGCIVGILAMPILPGLSDSEASLRALYEAAQAAHVDYLMPGGLTLRPGRQKELYLKTIREHRPDLLPRLLELYGEERPSGAPRAAAWKSSASRIDGIRRESGLPWLLPHRLFADLLPPHDSFRVLLRDMIELYGDRHVDTVPLRRSADRYDAWLVGKRREFRRKRCLETSWLDRRLPEALRDGELAAVLDNGRLLRFAERVVRDGARLDYRSLELAG
jgi:DNA repair photolyase